MTLRCVAGDARELASWKEMLGTRQGDVLFTDPPYCLLTRRKKSGQLRDKKDVKIERGPLRRFETVRDYRHFTQAWLSVAVQFLTPTAPLVIWTNLLGRAPILEVASALGFKHCYGEYIWAKKTREGNSGEELLRMVETALVFGRTPAAPSSVHTKSQPWAVVAGYDDDGEAAAFGNHPNHKPFGVLDPLMRTWSQPGQLVVDCFAGSGSIPAAALRLGRSCAYLELEREWAQRVDVRLKTLEHNP
jgi:site-specific DNA-methyltransferase (adenine-specific)